MPEQHAHGHSEPSSTPHLPGQGVEAPRARVVPLAPQRFGFQFTGDQVTHDLYEQFRALISHEIPSGEMAAVFKAALKIAVAERVKRKFASTDRAAAPIRDTSRRR